MHVLHLMLKETVLQGFISRVATGALKQQLVLLKMQEQVYALTQTLNWKIEPQWTMTDTKVQTGRWKWKQLETYEFNDVSMGNSAGHFWTYRVKISYSLDLLIVIGTGQLSKAFWVKLATVGKEFGTVLFGQLCAKWVDGDDEGSPVSFKLQIQRRRRTVMSQVKDASVSSWANLLSDKRPPREPEGRLVTRS